MRSISRQTTATTATITAASSEKGEQHSAIDQCVGSRARTLSQSPMPEANIECGQPHQFTLVFGRVTFHFFSSAVDANGYQNSQQRN